MRRIIVPAVLVALLPLSACKTASSAVNGVKSAGSAVVDTVGSVPSLINVNLSNVLNNLALDLKIDKANIPINAQIPINIAANVCGVSINVLAIGAGGGSSQGCTANSISPELKQYLERIGRRRCANHHGHDDEPHHDNHYADNHYADNDNHHAATDGHDDSAAMM